MRKRSFFIHIAIRGRMGVATFSFTFCNDLCIENLNKEQVRLKIPTFAVRFALTCIRVQ